MKRPFTVDADRADPLFDEAVQLGRCHGLGLRAPPLFNRLADGMDEFVQIVIRCLSDPGHGCLERFTLRFGIAELVGICALRHQVDTRFQNEVVRVHAIGGETNQGGDEGKTK